MKKGNGIGKFSHWPKSEKLQEALDVVERFRGMCQLQMDLGNWATMDYPTKHHINRILSLQYADKDELTLLYSLALVERIYKVIPYCKHYIMFIRESKDNLNDSKEVDIDSNKASS